MAASETKSYGSRLHNVKILKNPKNLDGVPDLSSLIYLEEPNVVHNVKCRYLKDQIYTAISSVTVAVNPYKQLGDYTNEWIKKYAIKAKYEKGLPHIYNVAENAYRQMIWTGLNQSMIVCGESGAGKTENAKFLMRHLAYTTSIGLYKNTNGDSFDEALITSARIEQQTLLNNNSSRFGKFTKLLFHRPEIEEEGGEIIGSAMETYLLEKSRIIFQAPGERNFHVFYQMCAGLDVDTLQALGIDSAEDFEYLNQAENIKIPGISDEFRFTELLESLDLLGFDESNISKIFATTAAVLHLGNIEFEPDTSRTSDACKITADSKYNLVWASRLLQINETDLTKRLTQQSLKVRSNIVWKEYNVENAIKNRDSTAKAIYSGLFDWVVAKINFTLYLSKFQEREKKRLEKERTERKTRELEEKLRREEELKLAKLREAESIFRKKTLNFGTSLPPSDKTPEPVKRIKRKYRRNNVNTESKEPNGVEKGKTLEASINEDSSLRWIGILDVFGFECFEYNSFEQFCINYTNETLQRYFNFNIMLSEQAEYQREGIFWEPIKLPDNKPTLDLISKRPGGIFYLLDSACKIPKATDETFTELLFKQHGDHEILKKVTLNPVLVRKGKQRQRMNGFEISHYAMPVCYDAKEFLVKNRDRVHEDTIELFSKSESILISGLLEKFKGKESQKRSLGYVFSEQLRGLMKSLHQTKPCFVRCIKPNLEKKPCLYVDLYVGNQLRCGGLIEAIKIIKCGYPTRVPYRDIFNRYAPSIFGADQKKMVSINQRDFCEAILKSFNKDLTKFEMGLTKVFFKSKQEEFLEELMRKGGKNWTVPQDLVEKIKTHLRRKRLQRISAFMKSAGRWLLRLRRIRAATKFARCVKISVLFLKVINGPLHRARRRVGTSHIITHLRAALAVQHMQRVRRSVLFMQRYIRARKSRSILVATLEKRIKAKHNAQELITLNKARSLASDEILEIVSKRAAVWLRAAVEPVVKVSENLFDGLSDGIAFCELCKKIDKKSVDEVKIHREVEQGSSLAKENILTAINILKKLGIQREALFEVDDLALMKHPRKVLNSLAFICIKATLDDLIPNIKPFPTIRFEISRARGDGKEKIEVCKILLFGKGGVLEGMSDDRKKELVEPGYLFKKREQEIRDREQELERQRKLKEIVEREQKAKEEADLQKQKIEKERQKLEAERQEFLEWKQKMQADIERKAETSRQELERQAEEARKERQRIELEAKEKAKQEKEAKITYTGTSTAPMGVQKLQFFCLTLTAVLRNFAESGKLEEAGLTFENFDASTLFEQAESEAISWHTWSEWISSIVEKEIEAKSPRTSTVETSKSMLTGSPATSRTDWERRSPRFTIYAADKIVIRSMNTPSRKARQSIMKDKRKLKRMETLQQLNTSREQARMTKVTFMVTKRNRFGSNQRRRFVFDFDALELQTFDKNGRSMKKRIAFKQFVSAELAQSRYPDNPHVILKFKDGRVYDTYLSTKRSGLKFMSTCKSIIQNKNEDNTDSKQA